MKTKTLKIISLITASALILSSCSILPFGKKEEEPVALPTAPVAVTTENILDGMFYVKTADGMYAVQSGNNNFAEGNEIPKELDETRCVLLTTNDVQIPTMYKDDLLVYYTTQQIPEFTLERMYDNGYSVGMYNLLTSDANKLQYIVGDSGSDPSSSFGQALSTVEVTNDTIVIDSVGTKKLTGEDLTPAKSIKGLKSGDNTTVNIYIGTTHVELPCTVDSHVFSAMEIYKTTEYQLSQDGYAQIMLPDYLMSGYYYINGVGIFRYVANNRIEGTAGVDFNIPYFYTDEDGTSYTLPEWNKIKGLESDDTADIADYSYDLTVDSTHKTLNIDVLYDLNDGEDIDDILFVAPSAILTSPLGDTTNLTTKDNDGRKDLTASIDGVVSGDWKLEIFNMVNHKFDIVTDISTGNADSFIHSGTGNGALTIYKDAYAGAATAKITWENTDRSAVVTLTSPAGIKYNKEEMPERFTDTYGSSNILLDTIDAGDYKLEIKGENLGRVWMSIDPNPVTEETAADAQTETPETESAAE